MLSKIFTKLYQYATIFIVVGSPLFFIPKTSFTPEVTYLITILIITTLALVFYVLSSLIKGSWHSVSRVEMIAYFAFSLAVVLSVVFSQSPKTSLLGSAFNPLSGLFLILLPVIMYLTRTLPDTLRDRLKFILSVILGVSALMFVFVIMFTGKIVDFIKQAFSGFSNLSSISVYLGLFAIGCLLYVKRSEIKKRYKLAIAIVAVMFFSWGAYLSSQDAVRPNFTSTFTVGKKVLMTNGIFGYGAGDFSRAWQLYKPGEVMSSPYFGYDFNQGSDTMSTMFVNLGIVGLLAFIMLTLGALYITFISYKKASNDTEHFILGMLTLTLLYFFVVAWFVPLSYSMLVLWMVVAGLGVAKAPLNEYHPSKKLAIIMVPLMFLIVYGSYSNVNKVRAFNVFTSAQSTSSDPVVANEGINKAVSIYPFDGFYRAQVDNYIQANRMIVASTTVDKEELKNIYLANASSSVNAGLNAVRVNPSNYQNYVSLGQAYELVIPFEKEGGYDRAKKSYEEALKIYPENPYIYIMLARLEASAGTKEGVRTQLTEALKKKQNFADALYLMSQLEASENKVEEAIAYALEAVKSAPNDSLTYMQAGLLYYGKKDYQNAVDYLKTALDKDPNNSNVAYFLALALRDGGRVDLAKQIGDELLKRNPGNADLEAFLESLNPKQEEKKDDKSSKASKK